ncbi:MAG: DNA repair protein RecN, partial [Rikenellaceae bacterium]
ASEKLSEILELNDIEYQCELSIRRVITPSKSRVFINDIPTNLSLLKDVAQYLVDIHSQHQTLLVGESTFQIGVVDSIAKNEILLNKYRELFLQKENITKEIKAAIDEIDKAKRDEDYLRFQAEELHAASFKSGEEEELTKEFELLNRAAEVSQRLSETTFTMGDSDTSTLSTLSYGVQEFSKVASLLEGGDDILERLTSSLVEIKESLRELNKLKDSVSENPSRQLEVEQRLDLISTLEQKHHKKSIEELLEFQNEISDKLSVIDNFDDKLQKLQKQEVEIVQKANTIAKEISTRRKATKPIIEKSIISTLVELGILHASFEVVVESENTLTPTGCDQVYFNFSANKNMPLQKIDKVASGGEMSRLMLALKVLISKHKSMPTMIFDEIDIGVSGRVADKMGEIMEQLSKGQQIINITHLPQVASKGEHHFLVYKENSITNIVKLEKEQRIEQIAVMISGSKITEAALSQAKELLKTVN